VDRGWEEKGSEEEEIEFQGKELGFLFIVSNLPPPGELIIAHPNTSVGYGSVWL
jgi:hypothetical protein